MQDGIRLALLHFLQQLTDFQCGRRNDLDTTPSASARTSSITGSADFCGGSPVSAAYGDDAATKLLEERYTARDGYNPKIDQIACQFVDPRQISQIVIEEISCRRNPLQM